MLKHFAAGSRSSKLSSWLSDQASPVRTRDLLEGKLKSLKAEVESGDVSMLEFWGGYRVVPESSEFWQGGKDRINDRFAYTLSNESWWLNRILP